MSKLIVNGRNPVKKAKIKSTLLLSHLTLGELFRFKKGDPNKVYMVVEDGNAELENKYPYGSYDEPSLNWEHSRHHVEIGSAMVYAGHGNREVLRLKGSATVTEEK